MSTPLIPKLFVQHAAGGHLHLAERLWNTPLPQLWGNTPAEIWNNKDGLPLNTVALRERVLNVFAPARRNSGSLSITPSTIPVLLGLPDDEAPITPKPIEPEIYQKGNGKNSKHLPREQWEALFGDWHR